MYGQSLNSVLVYIYYLQWKRAGQYCPTILLENNEKNREEKN